MKSLYTYLALIGACSAIACNDERMDAAKKADEQVKKDKATIHSQFIAAVEAAGQIKTKNLLQYEKVRNTLNVSKVSALAYKETADAGADWQAKTNADTAYAIAKKSMNYEEGKPNSIAIKKVTDDLRKATVTLNNIEDKEKAIAQEIINAENACSPGSTGVAIP